MKRAISAKTDFTEQNLPHNRWQLFGDLFKHRFGFLMKAGLLTALFFLPYFIWNTIMLEELRLLADTITETNAYEVAVQMLALSNTKNAVNVLFFGICAIGISGGVSVIQKCAWGEIVFISDFFVALKRDWLKDFFFGVILGLSYWLVEYAIRFVPLSTLDTTVSVLMNDTLKKLQDNGEFTELMYRQEQLKTYPFGEVWREYLDRQGMKDDWFDEIKDYEKGVLSKR